MPLGGLEVKIELGAEEGDASRLPRVATCFNQLYLPPYTGVEMLRCRLRREHPEESPEQIAKRIASVLRADRYDPAVFEKRSCSIFSAAS